MEWYNIIPMISFIVIKREKIYDFLEKYKIGRALMYPFVLPFVIYCLFKIARNEDLMMRITEAKKQKKISDYC